MPAEETAQTVDRGSHIVNSTAHRMQVIHLPVRQPISLMGSS